MRMESLIIHKTEKTPQVEFCPDGRLSFSGRLRVRNNEDIFRQIMWWLESFKKNPPAEVILKIELEHLHKGNEGGILEMIKSVLEIKQKGSNVIISWLYEADDEDTYEMGVDFQDIIVTKFKFIQT
jgi:hypothetical protein